MEVTGIFWTFNPVGNKFLAVKYMQYQQEYIIRQIFSPTKLLFWGKSDGGINTKINAVFGVTIPCLPLIRNM